MNKIISVLFFSTFLFATNYSWAQEEGEAEGKSEYSEKKKVTKFQEVILLDSVPTAEVLKRAVNFMKIESPRFMKTKAITTGSKAECIAKFKIKPKELNPNPDYTGFITMHVSIECKEFRYRYVITKITHVASNGKASGGDIDNVVPACGSMIMPDLVWKRIKGDAMKNVTMVISELKDSMMKSVEEASDEW